MARTVKIRSAAGTLVLDLSSVGYEIDHDGVSPGDRTWRRNPIYSPWVDGSAQGTPPTLDEQQMTLSVRVLGTTPQQVETRFQALLAAVEASSFLVEVNEPPVSVTYRAEQADSAFGFITSEMDNLFRRVVLTIPVQPTPAVTGV